MKNHGNFRGFFLGWNCIIPGTWVVNNVVGFSSNPPVSLLAYPTEMLMVTVPRVSTLLQRKQRMTQACVKACIQPGELRDLCWDKMALSYCSCPRHRSQLKARSERRQLSSGLTKKFKYDCSMAGKPKAFYHLASSELRKMQSSKAECSVGILGFAACKGCFGGW